MRVRIGGAGTVPAASSPVAPRWLGDATEPDPAVLGAKAANLAVARSRRLPVVDGFVVPVPVVAAHPASPPEDVRAAWAALSAGGTRPLVVRSSAPGEDLAATSMAGVYDSVIDVAGWDDFTQAYARVVASGRGEPMAVLVQRFVRPELGGVLFGIDPVSGRTDRAVIVAVEGGPHRLVSGEVEGRRLLVDRAGRVHERDGDPGPALTGAERRRLLTLARRAQRTFGGPQDIEWAIDGGRTLLLQSRPITTTAAVGEGPLLGPGPVAETFPHPITALEQDLWIEPLADAAAHVLALTGAATRRRLRRGPVMVVVDDQVAADLELLGEAVPRSRTRKALDPRPHLRHLVVAWQVGRLRAALPALAGQLLDEVDDALAAVPAPHELGDAELLGVLDNASAYLRSLHGHEMLAGVLLGGSATTGADAAVAAVAAGRAQGWSDEDIVARTPVALALTPPSLGERHPLPEVPDAGSPVGVDDLPTREALRLRVRWVHELTRSVVVELGRRLDGRGVLVGAEIAHLRRSELGLAVDGVPMVGNPPSGPVAPLPAMFRLSADGTVVAEADDRRSGVGAGGGRGTGRAVYDHPATGDVLVVRTLDPALAPVLPTLAGLVAETGSPLSHLAILAREHGVPVVVGHRSIRDLVSPGDIVVVDGRTGSVEVLDPSTAGTIR
jgi:phosphohistidine swiveling domain-containing protein